MALSDDVIARVPGAILIGLTNPLGGSAPTSTNTTLLAQACSSIEAWFGTYAQETYTSSVAIHVEVAVRGVVALLKRWGAGEYAMASEDWAAFRSECETVRATRSRARIQPQTTAVQTPTAEDANEKPPFDDSRFRDILGTLAAGPDDDLD